MAAALLAAIAFGLFFSTLLPGQDLGDTASFQAIAGERVLTPRQGYPLYFAVAGLFVKAMPSNPARATNLASAVEAALAVGVLVLVGAEIGGTLVAGIVAGLLACRLLHLLVAGHHRRGLLAARPDRRPLPARAPALAATAVHRAGWRCSSRLYALGFGNHLQSVLLLPAFALFLLVSAPDGPVSMLRPRIIVLALSMTALFALQYAWNFATLYFEPDHGPFADLLKTFWFDVTKTDWRSNMVATIPWSMLDDRFAMYWFDLRQQVGVPGAVAAVAGLAFLLWTEWRVGLLVLAAWLGNWAFAFTYNVGDTHVFYLAVPPVRRARRRVRRRVAVARRPVAPRKALARRAATSRDRRARDHPLLLAYPAWRAWDTYPAMDRSADTSPTDFFDRLTVGLSGDREIFARDIMWQLHNGLDYYDKYTEAGLAHPRRPALDPLLPVRGVGQRRHGPRRGAHRSRRGTRALRVRVAPARRTRHAAAGAALERTGGLASRRHPLRARRHRAVPRDAARPVGHGGGRRAPEHSRRVSDRALRGRRREDR